MSSEQISEQPLPPQQKRCPHCGEVVASTAATCWLCLEKCAIQPGTGKHPAPSQGAASGDHTAWVVVGVLIVVLFVGLAGLEIADPIDPFTSGWQVVMVLLVSALVLATPGLIRTLVASSRKQDPAPASGMAFVAIFLSSLGVTVIVGLAAFVAFFATCLGLGIGGLALGRLDPIEPKPGANATAVSIILLGSIGAGLAAAVAIAVWLFCLLWRRKS